MLLVVGAVVPLADDVQGISRSSRHKRSASGAAPIPFRKKRKFELGRQPAMTKLGPKRIHTVRVRGGNLKYRALRLDSGNFAWGSEHVTRKTRIISVVRFSFILIIKGMKGAKAIFADIGLQRLKQRTRAYQHPRERRHHPGRRYPLPPVVRVPCEFIPFTGT